MSRASGSRQPAQQLPYDLRVDDRAAGRDLAQRVDELLHLADPVLEQIADAGAVAGVEEFGRVRALHVLAQDEHRQCGPLRAQQDRRPQPLVLEGGRHADVGHDDVGRVVGDRLQQPRRVAHRRHDLVPEAGEQRRQALAQQDPVLGEDYAQASLTVPVRACGSLGSFGSFGGLD